MQTVDRYRAIGLRLEGIELRRNQPRILRGRIMENAVSPSPSRRAAIRLTLLALAAGGLATTGCQVDVGGQTLPSAYYLQDDIQYFPAGPEFKLSKEAAALKAFKKENGGDCAEGCGCSSCR